MEKRIRQLDAVRGIAILLVILHNESGIYPSLHLQTIFANGWMGVDLFFVLSGFLITGMLVDSKDSEGYFTNFYARRCLRIWPLYFSVLLLMFAVIPGLFPSLSRQIFERSSPWWAYPFFLQNFMVRVPTDATGPLGVTWSLAIEEQFYLVWPWVVRYCSIRQLRRIALSAIVIAPVLRLLLSLLDVNLYSNTFTRVDGLMAGALLALVVRSVNFSPSRFLGYAWIVLFTSLPLAFLGVEMRAGWIVFSLSAFASAAFVYLSLYSPLTSFQRFLANPFLIYTGTISYGLYLLHKIPFDFAQVLHLGSYPITAPIIFAASYGIAALSWGVLEQPFLSLKRFFVPKPVRLEEPVIPVGA